jgi:diguanylate cyclase (GGDEF)-like protein
MGHAEILMAVVLVLQAFFGLGWAASASVLRLAPRPALHWVVAAAAIAAALVLFLLRGRAPDMLTHPVANVLSLLALVAIRRGLQLFLRLPLRDRESAGLLLLCAALNIAWAGPQGDWPAGAVIATSACVAWTLGRTTFEILAPLQREFGRRGAWLVGWPYGIGAVLFSLRFGLGLVLPAQVARPVNVDNSFNIGVVLAILVLNLAINASLAVLVLLRLVRKLQRLSNHDPLTGLLNRRRLMQVLAQQKQALARHGEPWSLLLLDLDHFKRVNDEHGHAAGDHVLVTVAALLKSQARQFDQVARMGGEEFCIVLPRTGTEGALQLAGRVCQALAQSPVATGDDALAQPLRLTVSIGVASCESADETADQVLGRADRALYAAKHAGRNRVSVAASAPPAGHPGRAAAAS